MCVNSSAKIFGHRVVLVMHNLADDGTVDDNAHTTA